jgi:CTP:molybdopterin cytidylyltransferase MocA
MARGAHGVIILGAGRGARVGGPKALLLVDDVPLALAHARARRGAAAIVVVVTEEIAAVLAPRLADTGARLVVNALPNEWGPAASLRACAGELAACERWIVGPVDALPAREASIELLLAALDEPRADGAHVDAARFVRGHPIAARATLLRDAYAGEGGPPPLRDVLGRARVATVPLPDDPAVTTELDTVADVVRVTGARPAFAR